MDKDNFNKRLSEFFKRPIELIKLIGGLIIFLLSLVTAVVKFIKLLEGDTGLVTIVLIFVSIAILLLLFLYIYLQFRKRRTAYSQWIRRSALTCFFAVLMLPFAGYAIWKYYPSDKIIVLVADFEGPEPQNYRVTETIIEQLREATKGYDDVQVKALGKPITAQEGSGIARARGKDRKASIVLWGWYGKTKEKVLATVHFEVLPNPFGLPPLQEKETLNLAVVELESFTIQERLSSEMTFIVLLTIGVARYKAKDYDGAIAQFTDALIQAAMPKQIINPTAIYFYRGTAYNEKGDVDRAMADFNQAIKLKADHAEAYNNRGIAYINKGKYDPAIDDFNQTIRLKPDDAIPYNNRGVAYGNKGEYDSAITDFNQAIKLKSDNAEAYLNRGNAYYFKGDLNRAIADYNQAIKLKPYALAHYNRGLTYATKKGDLNRAIADFDKAIEIKPNFAEAYVNRGNAYYYKRNINRAIANYNQAIKLKPNALAYQNRGIAYKLKGDKDKAIADLKKVLELTDDPEMRQDARKQLQELGVE